MNKLIAACCAFSAVLFSTSVGSVAEEDSSVGQQHFSYAEAYPGRSTFDGRILDLPFSSAQFGLHAFQQVFGRWPQTWSEVVEAGLWQARLYGPQFETIDPDDREIDFGGDVVYEHLATGPKLHTMRRTLQTIPLYKVRSFKESYQRIVDAGLGGSPADAALLEDESRLKLLAIVGACKSTLDNYTRLHRYPPATFDAFLRSGFGPISADSINPVTGQRFYGDGRANDVSYRVNGEAFEILPIGQDESPIRTIISY